MADPTAFPNLDLEKINADVKKSVEKIKKDLNIDQLKKDVQADVKIIKEEILKEIPEAEITRMEFDMKDQMIRQSIITTQQDVEEIKKSIEKIEDKLYNR